MSAGSRVFWLRSRPPLSAANPDTRFAAREAASRERPSCRDLFFLHYRAIRDALAALRRPGLALLALDGEGLQATAHLTVKPDAPNCAILGRHSRAELALREDDTLSLRHLALLVPPAPEGSAPRLRVLDLRSTLGFADEHGRDRRGLEADGTAFLTCGRYALLALPSPLQRPLPEAPLRGWESLPARGDDTPADRTLARGVPGPRDLDSDLLDGDEEPLGVLVLRSERGEARVSVGGRALREGLLLGRAPRCEGAALLDSPHISRVHLLLIELSGHVYAVDTASHNGTTAAGTERRVQRLASGDALHLARGEAVVEWHRVH